MNQTHWCTCEGHNTGDFVRTTDFYSSYFQPIDCSLRGKFDDSGRTVLDIGTIKTLETNMDACKRMGALCGALIYHASAYVNENLQRYTPDAVLRAEAARLEEWRTVEASEMEEAL